MNMKLGKAAKQRLTLATVPRESGAADRLLDNSRRVVQLDLIDDNPRNPRKGLDEESLRGLAASIAEHGLLQAPVCVGTPTTRSAIWSSSGRAASPRIASSAARKSR